MMARLQPQPAHHSTISHWTRWWSTLAPYAFISPFYLIFLTFGLLPILFSLVTSLYDWRGAKAAGFIGLQNYRVLFADPALYTSLLNTLYVWLGSIPLMILLALILAVLLDAKWLRLRNVFRVSYFLPVVTSLVITGLIFGHLFSSSYGLVNGLLGKVGVAPINWLAEPAWMKLVLILALLWRWIGNDMVIMLAGLQSIPTDLYEAAQVDGATALQAFWRITVPLMRPVILFDAVISTIGTFNLFAEPFILFGPGGGMAQAGLVTGTFLYQNSFVYFKFGYGAAIAWVLAAIIITLSLIQLKLGNREAD